MRSFVVRLLINALSLYVAASLVTGIAFSGGGVPRFGDVVVVALVFGLVNTIIKPILQFGTCGLYVLTLGLFSFVVNALMLQLTGWLAGNMLLVGGFWDAFKGALVISVISTVLTSALDPDPPEDGDGPLILEGR